MKKYLVVLAVMAFFVVMAGGAYAQSPTTLNVGVTAKIKTNCVVTGGTLAFGDIDADGADVNANASGISIKCTKGTSVAVSDDDGLDSNKMQSGANRLPYTTTYTANLTGGGTGGGGTELATALDFKGTVAAAAAEGVPAGDYTDTIKLTLTY